MPAQTVPFCEYDGREIVKGLIVIDQADGSASWFCSYGCLWASYTPLGMAGAPAAAVVAELAGKMDPERAKPEADPSRCDRCGWTLAERIKDGCTKDNCSMRPMPPKRE
jgi:hypothetical protein